MPGASAVPVGAVDSLEENPLPEEIKGNARRTPLAPAASHADIDQWFGRQMPHLQPIVRALDSSIRAAIPGLHYAVKWKRPYYGLPELGWIIELAAYDVSANVVFFGGADFDSPPPLGSTGRTRYVKVTSLEEARRRVRPSAPSSPIRVPSRPSPR